MQKELLNEIKNNINKKDKLLNKYASPNKNGIRLKIETSDIRANYERDADRIIYSLSYTRYIDKTQVFSFNENDHISKRIIHVQMVSKIARTIGRALLLNEDLLEASALGHDIGHPPFGHTGEEILNKISIENNEGYFNHNIQSVRALMSLENKGKGANLCIQTLDAIMCHNGEIELEKYMPIKKTKEIFIQEYLQTYKDKEKNKHLRPMTLEGCVVRISDIIAYIGRDIEDAIRLNIITRKDIPKSITNVLGDNNSDIINTLVLDIIKNSYNLPYIKLSKKVFKALQDLKQFNYEHIYNHATTKQTKQIYEKMFRHLFNVYKKQIIEKNKNCNIYKDYLNNMDTTYIKSNSIARIIIDYIAGMTDDYFQKQYLIYKNYIKKDITVKSN